ncbi:flagellar hook-length control protein FliK [Microbacterium paraoxydans]|uniref:flagellar hook-length control protein FliK n=1 Tax=Microbacterium paraoxydans TaxID=199592 RepID=UPI001CFB01D1|nr:flagellar hook-length control protein FliK [Microbacterium paraoxydans]
MTALGMIEILDPRAARPSGASPARTATAGAAAFADVIHDASRIPCGQALPMDAAADGTADDEASPETTPSDSASAAPLPGALALPRGVGLVPDAALDAAADSEAAAARAGSAATGVSEASASASTTVPIGRSGAAPTSAETPALPQIVDVTGDSAAPAAASSSRVSTPSVPLTAAIPAADPEGATNTSGAVAATASGRASVDGGTSASVKAPGGLAPSPTTAPAPTADTKAFPAPNPETPAAEASRLSASPAPAEAASPTPASALSADEAVAPASTGSPSALPTSAPTTPAAAAAIARPVLLPQLAAPVVSLTQAADGEHSLTLTVSPENLGPVTVRAHISGGSIHIELHAPNDLGREALRVILADLRRDLAAAAPHATLMLSTGEDGPGSANPQGTPTGSTPNGNAPGAGGGHSRGDVTPDRDATEARANREPHAPLPSHPGPLPLSSPHGGIDVFA